MVFTQTRKNLFILLMIGFLFAIWSEKVTAQAGYTAVPIVELPLDVRMQSLGNSFVSFYGKESAVEINPASIGSSQDLRINFTKREWQFFSDNDPFKVYQFGIQYGIGKWGISYQGRHLVFPDSPFRSGDEIEYYHNLSASFNNQKGLSLGLGFNYIRSNLGEVITVTGPEDIEANAFSADFGFQYQKQIQSETEWRFTPSIGSSITDFGTRVKYSGQEQGDPLPMKFRTGVGLSADFDKSWNDFQIFNGNLAFGVSKLLVTVEFDETNNRETFGPFETLLNAWGTYETVDPNTGASEKYSLGEQLIFHTGLELNFLESFSFRIGYQNGQELNDYDSIRSIGLGVDLYYLAIDYLNSKQLDDDYEGRSNPMNGDFLQLTGRIPLDGKSPKSLLRLLF